MKKKDKENMKQDIKHGALALTMAVLILFGAKWIVAFTHAPQLIQWVGAVIITGGVGWVIYDEGTR